MDCRATLLSQRTPATYHRRRWCGNNICALIRYPRAWCARKAARWHSKGPNERQTTQFVFVSFISHSFGLLLFAANANSLSHNHNPLLFTVNDNVKKRLNEKRNWHVRMGEWCMPSWIQSEQKLYSNWFARSRLSLMPLSVGRVLSSSLIRQTRQC